MVQLGSREITQDVRYYLRRGHRFEPNAILQKSSSANKSTGRKGEMVEFDEGRRAKKTEKLECRTLCAVKITARTGGGGEGKTPTCDHGMTLSRRSLRVNTSQRLSRTINALLERKENICLFFRLFFLCVFRFNKKQTREGVCPTYNPNPTTLPEAKGHF